MQLGQSTSTLEDTRIGRFVRDHWLLALAIHPLLRCLILAESPAEMAGIQLAERFLWLSCWLIEAAVIVAASRDGFRLLPSFRALHPMARLLVVAWLVALLIGTLRAEYLGSAARSAFEWLMHAVFAMAVWHLVARDLTGFARLFDRFAGVVPWVTVTAGAVALGLVYRIGLSSDYPFGTDLPGFAHIRHTGYIFAPAMVLCLGRIATAPRAPRMAILLLVLNVALCLWFGSRGPFFGLIGGLAVAFVLFAEFRRPTFWIHSGSAAVAGVVLSVVVPSPENPAFNAVRRFLDSSADASEFSSGRIEFWKEAATLILDRPLFGYGGGQFQFISPLAANTYRHPHDFILQVIFDWGFIGGGAFLGLLALAVTVALKARRNGDSFSGIGLFGTACMLGFAALDGILFYPYTIAVTLIFVAAALVPAAERAPREAAIARRPELRPQASG